MTQAALIAGATTPPAAVGASPSSSPGVSLTLSGSSLTVTSDLPASATVRVDYAY